MYIIVVSGLKLSLISDGPAVRGSNVTFAATVSGYGGENLKFVYWDDAQPQHTAEVSLYDHILIHNFYYKQFILTFLLHLFTVYRIIK